MSPVLQDVLVALAALAAAAVIARRVLAAWRPAETGCEGCALHDVEPRR
jgi:hypothetical protein